MAKTKVSNNLSTKDIPDAGNGGTPKTLQPGNALIKINNIELRKEPFEGDPYNIMLNCEGEDMGPEFQGFMLDKSRPELGAAKGQVGRVRAQMYTFSDRVGTNGKPINKNLEMLKWLKSFCKAMGKLQWFDAQDDRHATVQEFIDQMNLDKPYDEVWLNSCLAGKPYTNQQGFVNYDLYLPWFNAKAVPLELPGTTPSLLIPFSAELHTQGNKKKAVASLDEFSGESKKSSPKGDFDL
jgi:hypothetical protein